jgi:hypothetical protein
MPISSTTNSGAISRHTCGEAAHSWLTTFPTTGSYRTRTAAHANCMRQFALSPVNGLGF